jgi:hypothetical protein
MQSTTTRAPSVGCHLITKINVTGGVDQVNQVRCLVDVNIIGNGLCVGLSGRITKLMSILLTSGKTGQALLFGSSSRSCGLLLVISQLFSISREWL